MSRAPLIMRSPRASRSLLVALVALGLACDKTQKPGPDTPVLVATGAPSAKSTTTAATTTEGPPMTTTTKMPSADESRPLARGSNAFAFDLWGRMRGSKGNLAVSPASISIALAMTYGGAKAETATQMAKVMHFEGEADKVMTSWGTLSKALMDPSRPMKLRIANRLFGEKTAAFEAPYLEQTRAAFGAPLEPLDFKTASEASRLRINGWVEEQTEKRIKDLIPPKALDDLTRLVLANAIYFLADWQMPFDTSSTRPDTFHMTPTFSKKVPTMHAVHWLRYAHVNGVQIAELPYKGGSTSMLLAVPDPIDGLAAVEASLTSATLDAWMKPLTAQSLLVALPRFEVNPAAPLELAAELKALGMPVAFDRDKADFTKIARPLDPRERLHIANVFHKAFVKVDEKGTEAAAATAVAMAAGGGPPAKPVELKVDRPFLFFILDKDSGLVVFMGRVAEP